MKDGITIEKIESLRNKDPPYFAEVLKNHLFFYFIGTLRSLGYNEYKVSSGELMTVDLDRARFTKLGDSYEIQGLTLCHICKIDQQTLETLHDVVEEKTLGTTIQHSLLYDDYKITFSKAESKILQARVSDFLQQCLDPCITKHGVKDVVIN